MVLWRTVYVCNSYSNLRIPSSCSLSFQQVVAKDSHNKNILNTNCKHKMEGIYYEDKMLKIVAFKNKRITKNKQNYIGKYQTITIKSRQM